MFPTITLGDSGQLIGVLLILAGAVGYLSILLRRKFKGASGGGCGSCGVPLKRPRDDGEPRSGSGKQFVPLEDLEQLAARRRKEQDADD